MSRRRSTASLFGDEASPVHRETPRPWAERPSPYRPPTPAELAARVLADRQAQLDADCDRRGWPRIDAADPAACAAHLAKWKEADRVQQVAWRAAHPWRE